MGIEIELQWTKLGKLGVIKEHLDAPTFALEGVGAFVEAGSRERFRKQGRPANSWSPRGVPNIPGVIADVNNGPSIKARRFKARPALVDTGSLRRSVASTVTSSHTVVIGTNKPYGGVQFHGGNAESEPMTAQGQRNLKSWLGREKKSFTRKSGDKTSVIKGLLVSKHFMDTTGQRGTKAWKDNKRKLMKARKAYRGSEAAKGQDYRGHSIRWLLNKKMTNKRVTVKINARPFIGIDDKELDSLKRIIRTRITRRRNSGSP